MRHLRTWWRAEREATCEENTCAPHIIAGQLGRLLGRGFDTGRAIDIPRRYVAHGLYALCLVQQSLPASTLKRRCYWSIAFDGFLFQEARQALSDEYQAKCHRQAVAGKPRHHGKEMEPIAGR